MERPRAGRVLAGVSSAVALHTGIPTWLVRLTFIVTSLLGGLGVLLYGVGWLLIPSEGDERAPAERWLGEVDTPSSRVGALLIGLAVAIALTWLFPFGVVAVVALLMAGLFLVRDARALFAGRSPWSRPSRRGTHGPPGSYGRIRPGRPGERETRRQGAPATVSIGSSADWPG